MRRIGFGVLVDAWREGLAGHQRAQVGLPRYVGLSSANDDIELAVWTAKSSPVRPICGGRLLAKTYVCLPDSVHSFAIVNGGSCRRRGPSMDGLENR